MFLLKLTADQVLVLDWSAGSCHYFVAAMAGWCGDWFNANPGLKVNRIINLSSIQVFFTPLGLLRSFKIKTEGH